MIPPRKPTDDWLDDVFRYAFPWIAGAFLIAVLVIVPLGSLAVSAYVYLQSGEWINISTGLLTGWYISTDWVGLNQVANWALALWVGVPSLIFGGIVVWAYENRETL